MLVCPSCGEENPDRFRLCGFCGTPLAAPTPVREERRVVTIVFSDLQGSTKIGEALDPESVRSVMSRYFDAMTEVLRRHGGTIEKFIGDAIMAVFGLPRLHEDDALRAVRAAYETQAALASLNDELERVYGIRLTNRTGVNTGEVVTGDAASAQRLVTGDTVNTAARLEQAAGPNEVLIGDLTLSLVRDAVSVEAVEPLELKGKAERVPAYRLVGISTATEGRARRAEQPLVGRGDELARLQGLRTSVVADSRPMLATVIGDAGVGKSRLIREFVDEATSSGGAVLRGRCLSYGEGVTYWPVVESLRDAAGIEADDSPAEGARRLDELLGDRAVADRLGSLLGFGTEAYSVDELTWAIRRWLEMTAERRGPTIWVVDDIHWAEPTFLDLLEGLASGGPPQPILVLCSARHDLLDRSPDWATGERSARLVLEPLDDTAAREVVANLLGRSGVPREVTERVVRAADGNPLFVEQLISMLVDSGTIREAGDGWELTGDVTSVAVPPTIQALLAARIDLLARDERAVIEPAAVIGFEFSRDAVAALVAEPIAPSVPRHLVEIARKQLIETGHATALDEDGYRFHHILIRDAAYQNLLKRERSDLHARFVEWVDGLNRERDRGTEFEEILAYHLEQAYRYLAELGPLDERGRALREQAAERLGAAGRRALLRGDMSAAANLLRRTTLILDDGVARARFLIDLGEALTELGSFAEATEMLAAAERIGGDIGEQGVKAKARLANLATEIYVGSDHWGDRVASAVEEAIPLFEAEGDHDGLALAWRLRVGRGALALQFGEAATAAEQVVRHARIANNRRYATRGASGYAQSALHGPTPVPEAIVRCNELLADVESDRRTSAFIRAALAQLSAMDGRVDEARRLLAESVDQLSELGSNLLAASSSIDSARIEILAGELPTAEQLLRRDHDALTAMGERYLLPSVDGLLARVLYVLDRFDEADELARSVEEIAADDDADAQAIWRSVRAMTLARAGRIDEAIALATEAVAIRRRSDAPVLLADALADFSEVLRFTGRDDEVRAVRSEALRLYEAKGDRVSAGRMRVLLT